MYITNGFKGNLAYNFMDLSFLCLSFYLEIYNMSKTKNIEILVGLGATEERKSNWEILSNLGFLMVPLVISLLKGIPSLGKVNS